MELRDYVAALRRRWLLVAAAAVVGVLGAVVATLSTTPLYRASTQTFVSVQSGATTSELAQGASFTQQQVASYTVLVTSPPVLGPVIDDLGLEMRADVLASRVTASSPDQTALIDISVVDESPAMAAAIADGVTEQFARVIDELEQRTDGSPTPIRLTTVRSASVPTGATSPDPTLNLTLGLLLGIVVGIGLAALREMLDTKITSETDVAKVTTVSVVGAIAYDDEAAQRPLIVQSDPHSPRAESFRRLRTNVQFLDIADRPHTIIITSSVPGEGKSTTSINLAIALADSGARVILVDADLRRPTVAKYMGLEGNVGLTTVLIGKAGVDDVVQPWGNGMLHILPSGQIPPNPSELLGSKAMSQLLTSLSERYDMVLVDSPPLLPVTDAAVLSRLAGGTLVVVGANTAHRNQLAESMRALESVGARILGVVLNRQARRHSSSYEYYRYESQPPTGTPSRSPGAGSTKPARGSGLPSSPTPGSSPALVNTWPGDPLTDSQAGGRMVLPPQHKR